MEVTAKINPSSAQSPIDVEAIRADFPILSQEIHGKPLVYLDNAASAQKPRQVIDTITRTYEQEYSNVHRGLHSLSNLATENYEKAREIVRAFLGAPRVEEIIFTRSATEAINLVASSYGAGHFAADDEILLTIMEHHSNIVPWHFHRERRGAKLQWAPVGADGTFALDEFAKKLSPRTKLVAITHMSNVLGTILPIKEIVALAHDRGIPVLVDGSQGAVHQPVDVVDLGCDFYIFTGHKTYGPSGIGVLWAKTEHLEAMRPYLGGGEMIESVSEDEIIYNHAPHKFEAGTPPIVQAIGLGAALEYMSAIGLQNIAAHEAILARAAQERLKAIKGLRIFGEAPGKGAIFAFDMADIHAHDISMVIDRSGVAIRAGTHCAQPLLNRFGVHSTCRASFGIYNSLAEVETLGEALERARHFFS